jgi:CRISPR-associated protein Csb2
MFCLKVIYLMGRSYAVPPEEGDDKRTAEWPPHPGRLFCSLVAAWGESGESDGGRKVVEWLEHRMVLQNVTEHPSVVFPAKSPRKVVTTYVPANDVETFSLDDPRRKKNKGKFTSEDDAKLREFMPETRLRNERTFPSVSLLEPQVWFIWPKSELPDEYRAPLEAILRCTTSLGHSSSLVSVEIADPPGFDPLPPGFECLEPDDTGTVRLRVPSKGRLTYLQQQYAKFIAKAVKTNRPSPGTSMRYRLTARTHEPPPTQGVFRELIPLRRTGGSPLGLASTHQLITALRGAVLKAAGDSAPEFITGHAPGSTKEKPIRSEKPHLAFVPLANVGVGHGDGRLLGVGVLLPELSFDDEQTTLRAIGSVTHLVMASAGEWDVEPSDASETRQTLRSDRWTHPSKQWATVTPFVFDRFPKNRHGEEAQDVVRKACVNIGLPAPTSVFCIEVQQLRGVPHSRAFKPAPARRGKPQRCHIHLLMEWPEPVAGPLCIGAGRYYGYGFCAPLGNG